jgi:curved DNA-binding protein CbpA
MRITLAEARTVLQVEASASEIELKRAFKRQALLTHPDKNLDDPTAKVSTFDAIYTKKITIFCVMKR